LKNESVDEVYAKTDKEASLVAKMAWPALTFSRDDDKMAVG
jgi:hypothetical protein